MKNKTCVCFNREELKEQLEKKKKGSRALADFEDKMNEVKDLSVIVLLKNNVTKAIRVLDTFY